VDQFQPIRPGQKIPGLPTKPWAKMLQLLAPDRPNGPVGMPGADAVHVRVKNGTANPLYRFNVLQVAAPQVLFGENAALFFDDDALKGTTPAAAAPFVVLQEPLAAGHFGIARILGLTRVKVNVTDAGHGYADCTTATDKLTSGATGPARILWKESGTGDKWAVVNLLGQAAGAGGGGGGLTHVFGQLNDVSSGGSTGGNNAITTGTLAAGEYVVSARTTATGVTPGGAGVLGSVGLAISASVSATINPSAGGRSTAFTNTASANAYGTVNLTARVLLNVSGTITVTGDCFWQTSVGWSSRTELEVWSNP
jgi:hypothetical protein